MVGIIILNSSLAKTNYMKHLLFVTLLAFLLPNCKKEQIIIKTPVPPDTIAIVDTTKHVIGEGSVLKNGISWDTHFNAYYHFDTKSRFRIDSKKEYNNGLSEYLTIEDIPLKKGKYFMEYARKLSDLTNFLPNTIYSLADYDTGIGDFYPDTTRNDNFIEVLRYDTIANEVGGGVFRSLWAWKMLPAPSPASLTACF